MRHLAYRTVGGEPFAGNVLPGGANTAALDARAPTPAFFDARRYGMWQSATLPESKADGPWQPQAWQAAWRFELANALVRWFAEEARRRGLCSNAGCDLLALPGLEWLRPPPGTWTVRVDQQPAWFRLLAGMVWEGPRERPVDSFLMTAQNPWFAEAFPGVRDWRGVPGWTPLLDTPAGKDFEARTRHILEWMRSDESHGRTAVWAQPRFQPAQWMLRYLQGAWRQRAEAAAASVEGAMRLAQRQQEAQLLTTFRPVRPWKGMTPDAYLLENRTRFQMQSGWRDVPLWRLPGLQPLELPGEGEAWQGARAFAAAQPSMLLAALDVVRASFGEGGGPLGALVALYRDFLTSSVDPTWRAWRQALSTWSPARVLEVLAARGAGETGRSLPVLAGVAAWPDARAKQKLAAFLGSGDLARIDPSAFWAWAIRPGSCAPADTGCLAKELIRQSAGEDALLHAQRTLPEAFTAFPAASREVQAGQLRLEAADEILEALRLRVAADEKEATERAAALAAVEDARVAARAKEARARELMQQPGTAAIGTVGFAVALVAVIGALAFWPR